MAKINGTIPKWVAQADAQNGMLTRLGSTQVLETTIQNAEDIINGTPDQRRMAQEALNHAETRNNDTTRENIRDHRTIVPEPQSQSEQSESSREELTDPILIRLRLQKEIEEKKVEQARINKEKSIRVAELQRLKNLDLEKEREINRVDKRKRDADALKEQQAQREDAAKAVEQKYQASIAAQKAREAEARVAEAQARVAEAQGQAQAARERAAEAKENLPVEKARSLAIQHEEYTKRFIAQVQSGGDVSLCAFPGSSAPAPVPAPAPATSTAPTPRRSVKPVLQNMKHVVTLTFNHMLEPSTRWTDQIQGKLVTMNVMLLNIKALRSGSFNYIPSLDFFKNEIDMEYIEALIKQECHDRGIHILIRDSAPIITERDDEGNVISRNQEKQDFIIPNYKFKQDKQLYNNTECTMEAYARLTGYKIRLVNVGRSFTRKKYEIVDRVPSDMAWHAMLQNFYLEYRQNPPAKRHGPKRVRFQDDDEEEEEAAAVEEEAVEGEEGREAEEELEGEN